MSRKTEGLIAAPFTAFHQDGSLDLSVIQRQAEGLVRAGVRGAFICGTTGESLSLTLDETEPESLCILESVYNLSAP